MNLSSESNPGKEKQIWKNQAPWLQTIFKFVWKHKRPQIYKTVLGKKNRTWRIMLPELRLYYKVTVIKTVWYWQKKTNTEINGIG